MGETHVVARGGADIVDFCLNGKRRHCGEMSGQPSYMRLWSHLLWPKIRMRRRCGWLEETCIRKVAAPMAEAPLLAA